MNKKLRRVIHNTLLKVVNFSAVLLLVASMFALAEGTWGWWGAFCLSLAWLSFAAWANDYI